MDENGDIRVKLADALAKVEILQSANHIGLPFERQMEAKLYLLRRQIAEYQSILECSDLPFIALPRQWQAWRQAEPAAQRYKSLCFDRDRVTLFAFHKILQKSGLIQHGRNTNNSGH